MQEVLKEYSDIKANTEGVVPVLTYVSAIDKNQVRRKSVIWNATASCPVRHSFPGHVVPVLSKSFKFTSMFEMGGNRAALE